MESVSMNPDHNQSRQDQQDHDQKPRAQQYNNSNCENDMNHHNELQQQQQEEEQLQQEKHQNSNVNHSSDDDVVVNHHLDHANDNNSKNGDDENNNANDDAVFLDDNNDEDDDDDDYDDYYESSDDDDLWDDDWVDPRTDMQKLHQFILNDNTEEFERLLLVVKEHNTTNDFVNNIINNTSSTRYGTNHNSGTLLMSYCSTNRKIQMIQLLLDHGANVNINLGYTALHCAVRLNTCSDDTINALRLDCTMKVILLLLQYGANVNTKTRCEEEKSALHLSAVNPLSNDILMFLVLASSSYIDINIQDKDGRTPLHYAIKSYNIQAIQYLIMQIDIDLYIKDNLGYCPMRLATELLLDIDNDDDNNRIDAENNTNTNSDVSRKEKTYMIIVMMELEHEKRTRHDIYKYL